MSEITGADFAAAATESAGTTDPDVSSSSSDFSDGSDQQTETPPIEASDTGEQTDDAPHPVVKPRGPIPFERHQSVLANTRESTRRDTISQIRSQYGPHLQVGHAFLNDPVGFVQAVMQHPAYAAQFRQESRQQPSGGGERDDSFEPELISDTGVPAYSARQVKHLVEQTVRQTQESLEGRLTPIEQRFAGADLEARATAAASGIVQELATAYGSDWAAMKVDVANLMQQDRRLKPETAAMRVWRQKIHPTIRGREREAVVNGLRGKASVSTERPSGSANGTPRLDRDKSWQEVFAEEARRAGVGR